MVRSVLIGAQICFPLIFWFDLIWCWLSKAPRWGLGRVFWTMCSRGWNSIWLVSFSFRATSKRLRCASLGELGIVSSCTRWVLAQVSLLLDVSHGVREGVTIRLMGFQILSCVIVYVTVMSGSWQRELLLSLGRRGILASSSAPSRYLSALCRSMPCLH